MKSYSLVGLLTLLCLSKYCCSANHIFTDDKITWNKALVAFNFWSAPVSDLGSCARSCVKLKKCLSFNYNLSNRYCDLNSQSAISQPNSLSKATGMVYSNIEDWPEELEPDCYTRPCNEDQVCVPAGVFDRTHDCLKFKKSVDSQEDSREDILQWVYKVTDFSSQWNEKGWSVNQVIGPPDVYPNYGDLEGSWASLVKDENQYIKLSYAEELYVTSLDIYETYWAGGVKAIFGKDPSGDWHQLWSTTKVTIIEHSRIFSPPLKSLNFTVKDIRIDIDCSASGSWVEIDAVQMRGTRTNPNK